jgi:hypothetical protein
MSLFMGDGPSFFSKNRRFEKWTIVWFSDTGVHGTCVDKSSKDKLAMEMVSEKFLLSEMKRCLSYMGQMYVHV